MTESFDSNTFKVSVINESGLYACIFGSTKKEAKKFKKWVTSEVIPSIRKTGSYSLVKPKTALELAKEQVALLEQIELQDQIIADQEQDLLMQAEVIDELFNYSSIIRIAKFNNCSETNFKWQKLKATSKVLKLEIKVAPCPRYGSKNLYSHEAWNYAYPDVLLPNEN